MSRLKSAIPVFIAISFTTLISYAADPFSFQQPAPADSAAVNSKRPPPLSASEFKSKVTEINKQSQKEMMQESKNQVSEQNSQIPVPKTPASKPSDSFTAQPPAQESTKAAAPAAPPPAFENPVSTEPAPAAAPPAAPAAAEPPAQSQTYTGFGASTPAPAAPGKTTAPAPASGGGWNVKY